jgi:hypothetical protein
MPDEHSEGIAPEAISAACYHGAHADCPGFFDLRIRDGAVERYGDPCPCRCGHAAPPATDPDAELAPLEPEPE